ncbi:MAG TPA: hypothetical protein VLU47_11070 [Blastocatellia bacterium]|nr:hypothetical protein [Blastocatellia bacterium]
MAVIAIEQKPTLRRVDAAERRAIREWEHLYPDLWLFIEVTHEDEWGVYEGKLVATAEDPFEFLELDKSYSASGIVTLETHGEYSEPQPAFVG